MFNLMTNLAKITHFKATRSVENAHVVDLIELKIRESEANLTAAKNTLASLIVRQRSEQATFKRLETQIADLEERTLLAMQEGREDLAQEAAEALADLENEKQTRQVALDNLRARIAKIKFSIEKAHRRLISLRQGAVTAKATIMDHKAQSRIDRSLKQTSSFKEAEELIARVTAQSDPFEEADVLDEIDDGLSKGNISEKLAANGFGAASKPRADDVLMRLKAKQKGKKKKEA